MVPTQAGQGAFGAIQEIVALLRTDPQTDWSKVDIDSLRQHLIDMDNVTLRAAVRKELVDGGMRLEITGDGQTLVAIQRMIPDHARALDGMNGWTIRAETIPTGAILSASTRIPAEIVTIRALGFAGLLVLGDHHRAHHLAMARGKMIHTHQ